MIYQMIIAQILSSVSVISSLRSPLVLVMLTISPIVSLNTKSWIVPNTRKTSSTWETCAIPQLRTYPPSVKPLFPLRVDISPLMDASTVPTPATPFDPMNPIFPPPSVACDSLSKQFAMNVTSCGDSGSSTGWPYVHMSPVGTEPLACTLKVTREGHTTPKVWKSTPPQTDIISSHDDMLSADHGMGFPHVGSNPIPIPIGMIPESPDEFLAPTETSFLGYLKLVHEDLEDNVHHMSTAVGEYISPPTSSLKVHLPPTAKDLCLKIDLNGNFLGFDVNGNYPEVDINGNFSGTDINGNLLGNNPNDNVPLTNL